LDKSVYLRARRFVLQRARPIDYARWCFHFEWASAERVLDILSQYQNNDGGFGSGLEADFWNPFSSPMQTWAATECIQDLDFADSEHPIVLGILRYLDGQANFDGHTWSRTIASNNDYPHAEWWSHEINDFNQALAGYNPTASLAAFALQHSREGSRLRRLAVRISNEAFEMLLGADSIEVHELSCFHRLLGCVTKTGVDVNVDIGAVERKMGRLINESITRDRSKWKTDYVCRPSRFIRNREDRLFSENAEIVNFECKFLLESQLEDGSWPVNWHWSDYPNEWPIAREWWKSTVVIENVLFLRSFAGATET